MADSIISIAVMEPLDGLEEDFLRILAELYALMERKGYSRDTLLRNRKQPPHYIHIRYWSSLTARQEAQEDPAVQRCWARLGNLCHMLRVHDVLDEVDWRSAPPDSERNVSSED
jgi:quinol monooxygenase YgiN